MCGLRARWAKHIAKVAIEVLNMRLTAQLEFVLAKTQCVQQYPVIEYFRARQIGNCDVDVVDSSHFGHGAVCQADAEWQLKGSWSWSGSGSHLFSATKDIPTRSHFSRPLKEIFFALMAYRQHGHGLAVFDFKQRYITVCAKADNQFAQQRMFRRGLAATKGKGSQEFDAFGNRGAGAFGGLHILFCEKVEQALQVFCGGGCEPDRVAHLRAAALRASVLSSPASTASAETYLPV
jgi:hypothetical protein